MNTINPVLYVCSYFFSWSVVH